MTEEKGEHDRREGRRDEQRGTERDLVHSIY